MTRRLYELKLVRATGGRLDADVEWLMGRLEQVERALLIAWRVGKFDSASTAALEELVLAVQLVEGKS